MMNVESANKQNKVLLALSPALIRRWWMCVLSGKNGLR